MTEVKETALETQVENTTVEAEAETVTTTTTDFVSTLTEDLRGSKSLEKFKSADDLAKSYLNLESKLGQKIEGAPEKYVMPEEISEKVKEVLITTGKEHNMTQNQINALANKFIEDSRTSEAAEKHRAEEFLAEQKKALEKEFGSTLENRLDAVKSVLTQYGDEDTKTMLKDSGLLHDAKFVKFLDKITGDVLKHTAVASDYTDTRGTTPAEALAAIEAKKADREFMDAYMDPKHIGHKLAVKEWNDLFQAAYVE